MPEGRNWAAGWFHGVVFDARLRPAKQMVLAPVARRLAPIRPGAVTSAGVLFGLAAALAAAAQQWWLALGLFAVNRLLDGLDGDIARAMSASTDHGGYVDMVADTVVYAALPLGAAVGSDLDHIWPIVAVLISSFYINTITWAYLSALLEKRRSEADDGRLTSISMPTGLVEGAETAVFFAVMLAVPSILDWVMAVMAGAVFVGAALRFWSGQRQLRTRAPRHSEAAA